MSRFGRVGRRPDHWGLAARACPRSRRRTARGAAGAERGRLARGAPRGLSARAPRSPPRTRRIAPCCAGFATPTRSRPATCGRARRPGSSERRRPGVAAVGRRRPAVRAVAAGASGRSPRWPSSPWSWSPPPCRVDSSATAGSRSRRVTRATARSGACGPLRPPSPSVPARCAGSGVRDDGAFAYNVANIDAVCPLDRQPDCAPFADGHARRVTLTADPEVRLPVAGRRPGRGGRHGCRRCGRRHRRGPAGAEPPVAPAPERIGRVGQPRSVGRRGDASSRRRRRPSVPSDGPVGQPAGRERGGEWTQRRAIGDRERQSRSHRPARPSRS